MRPRIDLSPAALLAVAALAAAEACSSSPSAAPGGDKDAATDAPAASGDDQGSPDSGMGGTTPDASPDAAETAHGEAGSEEAGPSGPGCAGSTALFCDDFESGKISSPWQSVAGVQDGTIAVDSMEAHSGTYALHVHMKANTAGAQATIGETQGFPQTHFFGRVFMWFEAPAPTAHTNYVFGYDSTGKNSYILGSQYQYPQAYAYFGNTEPGNEMRATSTIPTDVWGCWEWEFDGTTGKANYWLNGSSIIQQTGFDTETFAALQLGMIVYGQDMVDSGTLDLWFDDLKIDTARVGCN